MRTQAGVDGCSAAIDAGVRFLRRGRDRNGLWRDFNLAGESDEWVSAYIASILASVRHPEAVEIAEQTWRALTRRRWWSAGWGYNRWIPSDADSTIWALRLAEAVRAGRSVRAARGLRFVRRHMTSEGGIATYASAGPLERVTAMRRARFTGWCAPHTCVTAAAAGLQAFPERPRLLGYLRTAQRDDGSWQSYWWHDRHFATALAAEALGASPQPGDRERVQHAVEWARKEVSSFGAVTSWVEPTGSTFATAFCLRILALAHDEEARASSHAAQMWLLATQNQSGAWPASARLRVPPPDVVDPDKLMEWKMDGRGPASIGAIVLDQHGFYTTASALSALQLAADAVVDGRA
jgi:squalene-hopene/tetraprenyl-beta-curcumene cyclase